MSRSWSRVGTHGRQGVPTHLHGEDPVVVGGVVESALVDGVDRELLQHTERLVRPAGLVERSLGLHKPGMEVWRRRCGGVEVWRR